MRDRLVSAIINGMPVEVLPERLFSKAARMVQVNIPYVSASTQISFSTAACGLCIVKVEGSRKLPRACATAVEPGMEITTH